MSNPHPLLGLDIDTWEVTQFTSTVEIKNKNTGVKVSIAKPYDPKPPEWWQDAVRKAISRGEAS